MHKHIGSDFDDFLTEEGMLDVVNAVAVRRVTKWRTYQLALREVSRLVDIDPAPNTPEGDALATLAADVEAYESLHYPVVVSGRT
jgi:antitoxin component HigA of HigAB toxin-antitoxin module